MSRSSEFVHDVSNPVWSESPLLERVGGMRAMICVAMAWLSILAAGAAGEFPEVRVEGVRRAFHNGEHNAFTDLVRFQDQFFLTFRSCPHGHMVHPDSSIILLRSGDGVKWEPVHRFQVENRDTRDPHFLVFRNRLFVYTGTWYHGGTKPPYETWQREDLDR